MTTQNSSIMNQQDLVPTTADHVRGCPATLESDYGDSMTCDLAFKILGPLELAAKGERLPVGGLRQRTIVAMLLLQANRVVSITDLLEAVWNGAPPTTGRTQIAICIAALRKLLKSAGCEEEVLITRSPGYLLAVDSTHVDLRVWNDLVAASNRNIEHHDLAESAHNLEQALELWRGPALAGLTGHFLETEAARLEEQRILVKERYLTTKIALGHHASVLSELAVMVQEHPLRERARSQLMLAQYRSGRKAEALSTFREGRALSIEELGLEPSTELVELHNAILKDDDALLQTEPTARSAAVTTAPPPPADIESARATPARIPAFTGRDTELKALDVALAQRREQHVVPIAVIAGGPGVGKTGLATQWARRAIAEHYPDGLLHVRIGNRDDPDSPRNVLTEALYHLGITKEEQPTHPGEQSQLYQRILDDRRLLVLADDARCFSSIEPLIPRSTGCGMLTTTTRRPHRLIGSYGAFPLHLDPLSVADGSEMLRRMMDRPLHEGEQQALDQLSQLCGGLPLALEIVGSRLVGRRHLTPRHLASRMADERHRAAELYYGDYALGRRLDDLIDHVSDEQGEALYCLATLPSATFHVGQATEALQSDTRTTEQRLEKLIDENLLDVQVSGDGTPCYRLPFLLRLHLLHSTRLETTGARPPG
jgi:DNA-binding SARP family transcriptional activator